jgi:CHAD domain-containing protein
MSFNADEVGKHFRKLRKSIRKLGKRPTPEEVHDLRTRSRQVEASLQALMLDNTGRGRKALKAVNPIRKQAGQVRDMDVLSELASGLTSEDKCRLRLLDYLSKQRLKGAAKLHRKADQKRKVAERYLKGFSATVKGQRDSNGRNEWPAEAAAVALQLSGQLQHWPTLSAKNIHEFRKLAKQLRYVLKFSGEHDELADQLGELKDEVGLWHDWLELDQIAQKHLQHSGKCPVKIEIRSSERQNFEKALRNANRLRSRYFPAGNKPQRRRKTTKPVIEAASKLAA